MSSNHQSHRLPSQSTFNPNAASTLNTSQYVAAPPNAHNTPSSIYPNVSQQWFTGNPLEQAEQELQARIRAAKAKVKNAKTEVVDLAGELERLQLDIDEETDDEEL
jgi:hypothetical protein